MNVNTLILKSSVVELNWRGVSLLPAEENSVLIRAHFIMMDFEGTLDWVLTGISFGVKQSDSSTALISHCRASLIVPENQISADRNGTERKWLRKFLTTDFMFHIFIFTELVIRHFMVLHSLVKSWTFEIRDKYGLFIFDPPLWDSANLQSFCRKEVNHENFEIIIHATIWKC